jgi:hypothetical protein
VCFKGARSIFRSIVDIGRKKRLNADGGGTILKRGNCIRAAALFSQERSHPPQKTASLFDQLVGAREHEAR